MRLRPEQLDKELKSKLQPVYLITGDEVLLVQEAMDAIRAQCKAQGFTERKVLSVDRQFDWNFLDEEASALSLFAEKKLIELKLGSQKPGNSGSKALQNYLNSPPEDNVLLIEANRLDAATLKSKWASVIDKAGVIVQIWPIGLEEMPRWLQKRANSIGLKLDSEALNLLCDRLEGNLLAAHQELEKLKLNFGSEAIDADKVRDSVEDSSRYSIFDLTDACLKQQSAQACKILQHLEAEGQEVILCMKMLAREIRLLGLLINAHEQSQPPQQVFKQNRVIQKRQQALLAASRRHSHQSIQDMLENCKLADEQIKGMHKGAKAWDTLMDVVLELSGVKAAWKLEARRNFPA